MLKYIDPQGDVIFNISNDLSLVVSSKILSLASPVFAAMFSPRFREGVSLAEAAPVTIDLLEDAPAALETICYAVHFQHHLITVEMEIEDLLDIAVVADKYDIARSLGPWQEKWLKRMKWPEDGWEGGGWQREIFLTYVFGDRRGFSGYTAQALMCGNRHSLNGDTPEKGMFEPLPGRIMEAVEDARVDAIERILGIAETVRLHYQAPGKKCRKTWQECDAIVLGSIINHYSRIGIYPPPDSPYDNLTLGDLAQDLSSLKGALVGHQECLTLAFAVDEMVREVGKVVDEMAAGLDLNDFKKLIGVEEKTDMEIS